MSSFINMRTEGATGWITLNRPQALNAISQDMVGAMMQALKTWEADDAVKQVIITTAVPKAFSAGGDMRQVYQYWATKDPDRQKKSEAFFTSEYSFYYYVSSYPKPIMALVEGFCLGGGMGLALQTKYRVVTDSSILAMPEAALGFFPDVGAAYFLQNCPGSLGYMMGLSGWRLTASQAMWSGLATHYVPYAAWQNLMTDLQKMDGDMATVVSKYVATPPEDTELKPNMDILDRCLPTDVDLGTAIDALTMSGNPVAKQVADRMLVGSPTSLKLWQRHYARSQGTPLDQILTNEYRMACHYMSSSQQDVFEGVRVVLIDKGDNPAWHPNVLAGVQDEDLDAYFQEPSSGDIMFT